MSPWDSLAPAWVTLALIFFLSSDSTQPPLPVLSLESGFSLTEADQGKASTDMYVSIGLLQEGPSVRTNQRHVLKKGQDGEWPFSSDSEQDLEPSEADAGSIQRNDMPGRCVNQVVGLMF